MAKIWVLTKEYNDYNQHGEYFIHAWLEKPTKENLQEYLNSWYLQAFSEHILNGGGRKRLEDEWYNLVVVENA
jgi:hypothetical protein